MLLGSHTRCNARAGLPGSGDVAIDLQISFAIEEWARRSRLFPAVPKVMEDRVELGIGHVRIVGQVPFLVEQW